IVDIDFRFDARDGQYKVLDVNPRIGSTFRRCLSKEGMDVARALYLDLTGQPVPAGAAANGRKWLVEDLDLVAAFRSPRETSLTAWNWLKSLRGVQETAFLDFKDPLPALMMLRSDANELARRA